MLQVVPDLEFVTYKQEVFPSPVSKFNRLFEMHGIEVRGKPFDLDFRRYRQISLERRLVWIVARSIETQEPIGYACAHWYRDLNFDERVAADGLWYVDRPFRFSGVGKTVKVMCHSELKRQGAVRVYDTIRLAYNHPNLMRDLGFEQQATRWVKTL
jgi:hypothetical protein